MRKQERTFARRKKKYGKELQDGKNGSHLENIQDVNREGGKNRPPSARWGRRNLDPVSTGRGNEIGEIDATNERQAGRKGTKSKELGKNPETDPEKAP